MPKASPDQTSFNAGEFSPLLYGRVDAERYKAGMAICFNYIPTLQGSLIRRPGTKYVNNVKDPSKPPALIPFQFSNTQSYMLELGDQYMRFYANGAQVITSSNTFKIHSIDSFFGSIFTTEASGRISSVSLQGETITSSSLIAAGSILELITPYSYVDVTQIKWAQNADALYLTHPSYPVYKLIRRGSTSWDIKQVRFRDGPYLPLNSYKSIGDQTAVQLIPQSPTGGTFFTGPQIVISSVISAGASGLARIVTAAAHNYNTGDKIVIQGVVGTVGSSVNNTFASIPNMTWTVQTISDALKFDLVGSTFSGSYTGSGIVYPALFEPNPIVPAWVDVGRNVRLMTVNSSVWGYVLNVTDPRQAQIIFDTSTPTLVNTSAVSFWRFGTWSNPVLPSPNYPSAVCFHQDRLCFTGAANKPQQLDASNSGDYENFAPDVPANLQVNDNNALQFTLNSSETNKLQWIKSNAQGLLAGSFSAEWMMTPSSQSQALTPTNFNAAQTSFYGSANVDAVQAGNATIYVQRAYRKVREMNYFFQVGTFRSTDLTELSEHLTLPAVTKLLVQRETQPLIWGIRSDGNLISMVYNRDDQNLKVGWARHQLGGQSDAGGTNPIILSAAVIPAQDGTFDQMWMTVKRYINGSSSVMVEMMQKPHDDSVLQEDAFHFDCGATYDTPISMLLGNITSGSATVVTTAVAHGLSNSNVIRFYKILGLNKTTTDIDGNQTISNLVNGQTFRVASTSATSFKITNFSDQDVDSGSYSSFVTSGSGAIRKLVGTISGLSWLKGETVSILADGGIQSDVVVDSSGTIVLSYPAAKVQIGYGYNSDGKLLRPDAGSADGSSIGKTRRPTRAAFMLHNIGDLKVGTDFNRLIPFQFSQADQNQADQAIPLWSGIYRDGLEAVYDFDGQVCFRQSSGLPGSIQSITVMMEEIDV